MEPIESNADAETAGLSGAKAKRATFATQFRQASTSGGPFVAVAALATLFCATAGCTILLVLFNAVPLAMIVVGALYYDDSNCTAEKLALILIIGGVAKLLRTMLETCTRKKSEDEVQPFCVRLVSGILNLFLLCWFIASCVLVYRLHPHVNYNQIESPPEDYCDRTLFLFSFWLTNMTFIIAGVFILISCCGVCCVAALEK